MHHHHEPEWFDVVFFSAPSFHNNVRTVAYLYIGKTAPGASAKIAPLSTFIHLYIYMYVKVGSVAVTVYTCIYTVTATDPTFGWHGFLVRMPPCPAVCCIRLVKIYDRCWWLRSRLVFNHHQQSCLVWELTPIPSNHTSLAIDHLTRLCAINRSSVDHPFIYTSVSISLALSVTQNNRVSSPFTSGLYL